MKKLLILMLLLLSSCQREEASTNVSYYMLTDKGILYSSRDYEELFLLEIEKDEIKNNLRKYYSSYISIEFNENAFVYKTKIDEESVSYYKISTDNLIESITLE